MKPGDTVICIDAGWYYNGDKSHPFNLQNHPKEGEIYVIEALEHRKEGLHLHIVGFEYSYHSKGFTYPEQWNQAETMVNELTEHILIPQEI